jgi:hypothetical protein
VRVGYGQRPIYTRDELAKKQQNEISSKQRKTKEILRNLAISRQKATSKQRVPDHGASAAAGSACRFTEMPVFLLPASMGG